MDKEILAAQIETSSELIDDIKSLIEKTRKRHGSSDPKFGTLVGGALILAGIETAHKDSDPTILTAMMTILVRYIETTTY